MMIVTMKITVITMMILMTMNDDIDDGDVD